MAGYQYTIIVGNLTRDPELRYTPAGRAVCDFGVAVNKKWTDKATNEKREKVTFFDVSVWGNNAENCNEHLRKGQAVTVTGEIAAEAYTPKAGGDPRASLKLTARDVIFGAAAEPQGGPAHEDEEIPF